MPAISDSHVERQILQSASVLIADLVLVTAWTGWPYPREQIDRLWPFMVQSGDLPHLVFGQTLALMTLVGVGEQPDGSARH
jgi:hypothetical protein